VTSCKETFTYVAGFLFDRLRLIFQYSSKWNGGWPNGNQDINWETDAYHQRYNPGPLYMASVSPAFFTVCTFKVLYPNLTNDNAQHYGPNSYNKNWIYRGDDWLYASRWDLIMQHRDEVDIVEIVTWNGTYLN
jgi:glucan endo-1,3-alpha-glucosidase